MKPNTILQRMVVMLITLMSALGANAQEAYACYTSSNTTLTFYYDNQRSSREGTTYDMNTGNSPDWFKDRTNHKVTKVVFEPSFANARPTFTNIWFNFMEKLETIEGLSYLNTSGVTNMAAMFQGCSSLTTLDLSSFNTSKVTDMTSMFNSCHGLQTIYVGNGWSTDAVTKSEGMFEYCTCLVGGQGTAYNYWSSTPTDKTYAHVDGGTDNPGYFTAFTEAYACYTESNTTLTFYYDNLRCIRKGTRYDLNFGSISPSWFTDGTYDRVTKVVFDPSFASARPTTTYAWFYGMTNLKNITDMSYLNTSEVTNMAWMFYYCSSLTSLNIGHFNTFKVTDMGYMFGDCSNLQTIYVGDGWSTDKVTKSDYMFYKCTSLKGGQGTNFDASHINAAYAHIDGGASDPGYFTAKSTMAYACYSPGNTTLTFYYDNMWGSRTGASYDLKTEAVAPDWFFDNTNDNVTKVVFDPSFADARPTTTNTWFYDMKNLQTIEGMNYLNTSEVTDMVLMFRGCDKLTSLDLSSFNTSNVIDMRAMFAFCTSLTSLDLSSFNTSKVTSMSAMFSNCSSLKTIYVGDDWSTTKVTSSSSMFQNCTSLVGGQGTTWKETNLSDKTYAHIDGEGGSGYFTYKKPSGITTALRAIDNGQLTIDNASESWYTLDGRKLNGQPTKKGVYIHNGKTVIR